MVRYLFYTIGDLTYQSPLVYEGETGSIRYITLRGALHENVATITFHCVAILILIAFLDIVNVAEKAKSSPVLVTPLLTRRPHSLMREVHLSCLLPGCAACLPTLARLLKDWRRQPTGHGPQVHWWTAVKWHVLERHDISGTVPPRLQVPVPTLTDTLWLFRGILTLRLPD